MRLKSRKPFWFSAKSLDDTNFDPKSEWTDVNIANRELLFRSYIGATCMASTSIIADENPQVKHHPHYPPPPKRIASPPKRRSHHSKTSADRNADADERGKVCFGPVTNHSSPKPWNKCKRTFVEPNVTLVSPPWDNVTLGDTIHYRIESNLALDRHCVSGGNFWFAVLASARGEPEASCGCFVVDHCNGSYDLFTVAAWAGKANLNLTLVHTGEAVNHLRNVVWPAKDRVSFIGFYHPDNVTDEKWPRTGCNFRGPGNWTGLCEYEHPKAMGDTRLVCENKDNVPCETLYRMKGHGARIEGSVSRLTKNVTYLFASPNSYTPVSCSSNSSYTPVCSSNLTIKGTGELVRKDLPRCRPDQPIPKFQGYWKDGVWHSLLCAMRTDWLEKKQLGQCLQNKRLVLLGDSTTRQWFTALSRLIGVRGVKPPGDIYCCHMVRVYEELNLTMWFQIHPHVLASYAVDVKDTMFEVDVFDGLDDPACNYIVVISPWAHFTQWTHHSYLTRTKLIREAVIRFRKRCPDVPIVVKGPHPRNHKTSSAIIYGSDYLIWQVGLINQETFHGIGVWFLPLWDINLAYPKTNNVHMPMEVVREELKMLLGLVCEKH
ncbi:NXPE family member 3-like [Patiria miniata]|uniref:NXPE C-terminal domain-containing protein n=1 Tax=Patiria miniata TaxID=46514 RepID=A0A914B9V2_PATMI|nr:NXPE family member 3-like [Patiria miniata]